MVPQVADWWTALLSTCAAWSLGEQEEAEARFQEVDSLPPLYQVGAEAHQMGHRVVFTHKSGRQGKGQGQGQGDQRVYIISTHMFLLFIYFY